MAMAENGVAVFIKSAQILDDDICIEFQKRETIRVFRFWFRDNCRCNECYNYDTFQRKNDIIDIPEDVRPQRLKVESKFLRIDWDDGHRSTFTSDFLWKCRPDGWQSRNAGVERVLWYGHDKHLKDVAYVPRSRFLDTSVGLRELLRSLIVYGVGFVTEVAPNMEDTARVMKRIGPLMNTMFGETWHFTSDMARADTAYTTEALGPHTDNTYFTEAAGLQILHCISHDGDGGETILLDGFRCAEDMRTSDPKLFDVLARSNQPGEYHEPGYYHRCEGPTIVLDDYTGALKQIRFNTYDRSPECVCRDLRKYYAAYKSLAARFNAVEAQWRFKLTPGTMVFFDNWRVLHGRTAFTGRRFIGGAYVARADYLSAARVHGAIV